MNNYYQAEMSYLTQPEMSAKAESRIEKMEALKDMIYDLENELDALYENGICDDDKEWELEELRDQLSMMA